MRFLCARSNSCCMRFKTCSWLFNIVYCSAQWLRVPAVRSHVSELHGHEFVAGFLRIRGSSPRMRGKHLAQYGRGLGGRIIPAHAGQTVGTNTVLSMPSDHPRACGANRVRPNVSGGASGSSPHMRGKQLATSVFMVSFRIIPAHAGQTDGATLWAMRDSDHPRTCGANYNDPASDVFPQGSSPHMRGKRQLFRSIDVRLWIIPAHAGQTKQCASACTDGTDHPRTCGANFFSSACSRIAGGSSPHMRGKLGGTLRTLKSQRIIPAHAGQTRTLNSGSTVVKDHPRTCGANLLSTPGPSVRIGSSPHMRGKHRAGRRRPDVLRIIPAHAGQTFPANRHRSASSDHPRTCGANYMGSVLMVTHTGSSPHMRGKQSDSISKTHSDNTRKIRFAQSVTLR